MKDHRHTAIVCPACGAELTASICATDDAGPEDGGPEDGDPSLCGYCRALLVFEGSPASLRRPTPEEEREFLADANVQRAIAALAEYHRDRGNR